VGADPTRRPKAVVAVAASAGGVEALSSFVSGIPREFEAAVVVVLHVPSQGPSVLPGILARAGVLPARHATDGERLERGVILVAPPDRHLTVADGTVSVLPGPRENGHRPSADALLRSVAESFGTRSAGVVLSGTMDDGAAGLRVVSRFGGLAIAQDPLEASFPGMPLAAIEAAETVVVSKVHDIGRRLDDWLAKLGVETAEEATMNMDDPPPEQHKEGELTPFTCPECGGSLWKLDLYGIERFRCRVGHSFSRDGLMVGKQHALEAAVWAAIVALEEKGHLCRRIAKRLEAAGRSSQLERYRRDLLAIEEQLGFLRGMADELIASSLALEEHGEAGARSAR
jgi:two-component system, chemotaxis family, protein-glutamate methylesterase/glutaminase